MQSDQLLRKLFSALSLFLFISMLHLSACETGSDAVPISLPTTDFTWKMEFTETRLAFNDIHFINASLGWAVGQQTVMSTAIGGSLWSPAPLDSGRLPQQINSVFFVDEQTGWMAASNEQNNQGEIFITKQGGAYPILQQSTANALNSVFFLDRQTGWVAGDEGEILHTNNAGMDWDPLAKLGVDLFDIHFTTNTKGWVVGEDGALYQSLDGTNFTLVDLGTDANINAVHFTDTLNGWVCGLRNNIYRRHLNYRNEVVWSSIPLAGEGSFLDWHDIFFLDKDQGWIVGEGGRAYKTTDGGLTWERERIPTFTKLNAVFMISPSRGWIAGDDGVILTFSKD